MREDGSFEFVIAGADRIDAGQTLVLRVIDGIDGSGNATAVIPVSGACLAAVALPAGVLDLGDVDAFIASFLVGCP